MKKIFIHLLRFFTERKSEIKTDKIILLSLSDLLDKIRLEISDVDKMNEKKLKKEIQKIYLEKIHKFSCKKNIKMEEFINITDPNNNALVWELKKRSRTYFLIEASQTEKFGKISIVGFFTIGLTTIDVDLENGVEGYSKKKLEDLFKETKISYLIGKIAKNDKYSTMITGKELIDFAMEIINETHVKIGRNLVMIEAYYDKIVKLYKNLNFEEFQRVAEKSGDQRVQLIKKI